MASPSGRSILALQWEAYPGFLITDALGAVTVHSTQTHTSTPLRVLADGTAAVPAAITMAPHELPANSRNVRLRGVSVGIPRPRVGHCITSVGNNLAALPIDPPTFCVDIVAARFNNGRNADGTHAAATAWTDNQIRGEPSPGFRVLRNIGCTEGQIIPVDVPVPDGAWQIFVICRWAALVLRDPGVTLTPAIAPNVNNSALPAFTSYVTAIFENPEP